MNLRRKLKINWCLWFIISLPPLVLTWVRPYDLKGWTVSDFGYLADCLRRSGYTISHDIAGTLWETFVLRALIFLFFGWIAQYLVVLAWQACRGRSQSSSS